MITYRLATISDNHQLIDLTAVTGMKGDIALRIDRNPDFFQLLNLRGESKVFVALDGDTIIGSICISFQQVYVGGQIFPLLYIGDFKVAASHRNRGIGLELCNQMANYVVPADCDLSFLNVAKGNDKPFSFFTNRPHIPDFETIGLFVIHQFLGKKKLARHPQHKIEESPVTEELIRYLNARYSQYELGPVITKDKLEGTHLLVIREDKEIIAAICLADTMAVKQNVVMRLSVKLKILIKILNAFSWLTGFSKMPQLNEPVRMIYIKYMAVKDNRQDLVKFIAHYARNRVYEKGYSFVSIGLHERDPLNQCFSGLFKLTFKSVGMLLSIKNNKNLIEKVKQGIPFEDYSLV